MKIPIIKLPKFPWHGLDPSARRGLLAHALFWQAMAMAFQFINIYVFRLSQGYAKPALYQIWSNATIPLGFALGAWIARRRSGVASFRGGLIMYQVFLVTVLILRERCVDWLFLLGLISGIATGLYWQGWTLILLEVEDSNRDSMMGTSQWVYFVAYLTGAPLAGWFLSRFAGLEGYTYIYIAATLMLALAWRVSLPLKTKRLHGAGAFKRLLKARKPRGWNAFLLSSGLAGLMSVSVMFLTILVSYEAKGNETGTGSYNVLNAGCGFLAAWGMARLGKPNNRRWLLMAGALVSLLATLPLVFDRSFLMILLYGAGMAISLSFYSVPLFSTHLRIIDKSPRFRARRADVLTMREIMIDGGRIVGNLFILLAVHNIDSSGLSWFFVAIAVLPLLNAWLMRDFV
jgi:YQGE family putative transporter